ncbi:GNAT family N-acetyltransferase [Cellulophaga sp. L1A9]|uniref:GNAT family N-acetyltransferase n=1 Tax=Cellulophaga sp. L1A9 TaxID=2686362 RepID=UPI00131D04DC|nr:GNAT family N-acetyltransferase [Cellulophaga sp. L1A9]
MEISIIPYEPIHSKAFHNLNVEWLEKYFYVEEKDKELLNDCENTILKKNGHIFLAKYEEKIVGCFSFIPINDTHFELGKMAVSEKYQGLKIGQALLKFAIRFGEQSDWDKIILYSSTKLPHALYLYKKYNFVEVPIEKDLPYARSDIKMELQLK